MLQLPKLYRVHNLTNFWRESYNSGFKRLSPKANGLGERPDRRWIRRPISTKPEVVSRTTLRNKSSSVVDGAVTSSSILNISSTNLSEFQKFQYVDTRQMIADNKDLASLVTVVVFDLETTGLCRERERIIEIAIQDLAGGKNSTFHTLVNPGCYVTNFKIHRISNDMVTKPGVPRMQDLVPILLQYVKSRQKPGGYILWVAHNARSFDVPFLVNEFKRCNTEIPQNWLFVDTLPLAYELMKLEGTKDPSASPGTKRTKASLQIMREHYKIPLVNSAHRAMSDVNVLSSVLQRLTIDMKMTLSDLVAKSFTPSDLKTPMKKTTKTTKRRKKKG